MSTAAAPEIALSPEVQGFLKQHQAEIAFEKVCELVRECYPHLLHIHARLRDDPDVEDREWCVIDVTVPLIENVEQRLARWQHYHQRLVAAVPFEFVPLFAMSEKYCQE